MSVARKSIEYAAAALIVAAAIIAASTLYMGIPVPSPQASSSAQAGQPAVLAIRLTDPPQVPHLTSSLNLTYTSLSLLVGEPTGNQGQLTKSVAVTPSWESATIDLLKLQNVSQTIALASLPTNSVLYSVTFTVKAITIDVNNTVSTVLLATGGSDFTVTIGKPSAFSTGDYALLQLNPVVVDTPSGYQLIPSSVGIMGHEENHGEEVGSQHNLTSGDNDNLRKAHGSVTAGLVALSVEGNATTVTVRVDNSGSAPIELNGIGLHGNFTVFGNICQSFGRGLEGSGGESHTTTTQTETTEQHCEIPMHMNEVVFVPVAQTTSTTTTTASSSVECSAGQMSLVNGDRNQDHRGLVLSAGQCIQLTFVGQISFGESHFVLIPSTLAGQTYVLHIIASNGVHELFSCALPPGANSCKALPQQSEQQNW